MQIDANGNILINGRAFQPDLFSYPVNFAALTAGTTQSGTITIQSDAPFLWQQGMYQADIAAAAFLQSTQPVPNILITIQDGGSGRNLMSGPVPVPCLFGNGQLPFTLPNPRLFSPNATLAITVQNYDAAAAYNLRLVLLGLKLYGN